jgi:hypothetical protein
MDVNDLRSVVTVISLVLFLALVANTWSRQPRRELRRGRSSALRG